MKKSCVVIFFMLAVFSLAFMATAEELASQGGSLPAGKLVISQIDASHLLLDQKVRLFLSLTDSYGNSLPGAKVDEFSLFESTDDKNYSPITPVDSFKPQANAAGQVDFLLLIDNSGSMYDTLAGEKATAVNAGDWRITQAKDAVREFMGKIDVSKDMVGFISYNTGFNVHTPLSENKNEIMASLEKIKKPVPDEAYTELYASIYRAARQFKHHEARKVLVVLSDGENWPYFKYSGKEHKEYSTKLYEHTEGIKACQEEGVSVFAINFLQNRDPNLRVITQETGGDIFDAVNKEELKNIYFNIREKVLQEYEISYRASMAPAEKKYVKVVYKDANTGASVTTSRFYFASTILGVPIIPFPYYIFLFLLFALAAWILLFFVKFEKKKGLPRLSVLDTQIGHVSTKIVPLEHKETIIGGSTQANLTIAGVPEVKQKHATIIFDEKTSAYTLIADGDVTVNNKDVQQQKRLEAGDVINVGGTTIVFDDGEVEEK